MADTAHDETVAPTEPGRRTGLVWTLIVVAALIALVSSTTVWVKRQALDTDSWVKASSQVLQNDQVRTALSVYIVDQLYTNGDVQGRLQQSLPPNLAGLAGPISGALREPAVSAVDQLLAQPRVQTLWAKVNRVAHEQLVAILSGQPRKNVSTANGTVVLDLRSFIVDVGGQLGIGAQLDQKLPADVGQVTVLKSDQLSTAQDAVKAIKALSWLLGILTFVLWGVALWLAHGWRRAALRGIGGSMVVVGLLLLVIRRVAGTYVVNALTTPGNIREAASATWLIATTLLATIGWAFIIYGVCVVLGAWLAGPSRVATDARSRMTPVLADRPGLAWTGLGIVFLLLVWWGPTHALHTVLGVVILGALLAAGFEALRRIVVDEQAATVAAPEAPPIPAARVTQP